MSQERVSGFPEKGADLRGSPGTSGEIWGGQRDIEREREQQKKRGRQTERTQEVRKKKDKQN